MKAQIPAFCLVAALIAAAAVTSCKMESTMQVSAYGIYMSQAYEGHSSYFVRDDSTLMYNVGSLNPGTELTNGSRVYYTWTYNADQEGKNPMSVDITGYSALSRVSALLTNRPDTLGSDGADLAYYSSTVPYLGKVGGVYGAPVILDLGFDYAGTSSANHTVGLCYGDSSLGSDNYFHMTFVHKASTADTLSQSLAQLSFTLPEEAYKSGVKGVVIKFDGIGTDRTDKYYRFTYETGVTEQLATKEERVN